MTPAEFAAKWRDSTAKESAAAQEHFIDLCRMLGTPTPNEADPTGEWYAFEKGAGKAAGGDGFADVWKRRHFAWEYKGRRKDLGAAYLQLLNYSSALDNPPILVVCDLDRFEVRTNFTNTPTKLYAFDLADLAADPSEPVRILRALMTDPEELRPREAADELTGKAASHFAELAIGLRARGEDPQRVAHFLDKLLFCLYAEDAGVLPKGLLSRLAEATRTAPEAFAAQLGSLFATMAGAGGFFGVDHIDRFDGGLFADADVLTLTREEIAALLQVGRLDWSLIEPAIFGTLFERGLDPGKRSQLGAHYTDRGSIERLVEPVVMDPLRREFAASQIAVEEILAAAGPRAREKVLAVHHAFLARLRGVRVLDPACGSGNFLFVALRKLKDLEYDAIGWGSQRLSIPMEFPQVGPEAVQGIEINPYAAELARVSIWIGEIQWMLAHSFAYRRDPVLRPLDQIRTADALLDLTDPTHPAEAQWPAAEFIVGNPPFLGRKLLRGTLGAAYVDALFEVFDGRVAREADLCVYFHEKARAAIARARTARAGLLATRGTRRNRANGDSRGATARQVMPLASACRPALPSPLPIDTPHPARQIHSTSGPTCCRRSARTGGGGHSMPAFHPRLRAAAIAISALALIAVGAGGTFAASNPTTLYACYDVNGNVKLSDKAMCLLPGGGRLASWGTAAVPGPMGATGPTGPTGPTGATGPKGDPGTGVGVASYFVSQGFGRTVLSLPWAIMTATCDNGVTGELGVRVIAGPTDQVLLHLTFVPSGGTAGHANQLLAPGAGSTYHMTGDEELVQQLGAQGEGGPSAMVTISETAPSLVGGGCWFLVATQTP